MKRNSIIIIGIVVFIFVLAIVLYYFYTSTTCCTSSAGRTEALDECISLCNSAKSVGKNLSNGPCLSNKIIENWVCDIAHNPRQAVDDDPNNQCSSFSEGIAHHFVELDTNCSLIRTY